ncbi:BTAD domain-containing putative transcriptional regulator [Micromonospora sp. WMMA1363]|uniref:AfsR/SARP family transcriptional regulator n=1 Tax=Micromonospora sp. WMMA1363 TaxID=3053985 RepID=UPI00259D2D5F|nr:BTAD domain-containing putative transcriptional regulator [Micromonospora sp. WMMA1363]MDM4722012.1 BTAD domain-containing putative transcriptional regulator [Micromonospora sp. WMMA1363]
MLGPLSVRRAGVDQRPASATLCRFLTVLALHHPAAVSRDALVEALWPDGPPKSCHSLLHVYLRQFLEPGRQRGEPSRAILSAPGGFALGVKRHQLDLGRFDDLLDAARQAHSEGDLSRTAGLASEALRYWRGPRPADADPAVRGVPAAVAAHKRRVAAALLHADMALALGRFRDAVGTLRGFVQDEPLHEGLHARLMVALASSGEQAAALGLYGEVQARLDEELGIEPGPELRETYLRVLRQELPPPADTDLPVAPAPAQSRPLAARAVPAQLPAQVTGYVGRERQLRQLDEPLADKHGAHSPLTVSTVVGPAGVGKTALAVHWAHRARDRFPDGQLFVDLRGNASVPPLRPLDALTQILRALGVSNDAIPDNLDEAAAMFRSLVAKRRILMVLDNAGSVEQVRPLFPGGPGCHVLITSRSRLSGLVAREGARPLTLDVLSPDEAHTLLSHILGPRATAEPRAVSTLARLCAWLPLAIRIAAANVVTGGYDSVSAYCHDLHTDGVLHGLSAEGDEKSAVRAAFDQSYLTQDPAHQRMFRLLSLMPGTDVTVPAAATLAGIAPAEAARLLRRLAETHVVDERTPGRFSMHDLLRRYAEEHAHATDSPADRLAARRRLLEWYVGTVEQVARLLYPDSGVPEGRRSRKPDLRSHSQVL